MAKQTPSGEGVKDVPAVPGSLAKGGLSAPLGSPAVVPDTSKASPRSTS